MSRVVPLTLNDLFAIVAGISSTDEGLPAIRTVLVDQIQIVFSEILDSRAYRMSSSSLVKFLMS